MHAQTPKAFSTRMLTCLADTSKQSVSNLEISLTYAHKAGQTTVDRSRDLSNELAVLKSSFIPTMMSHRFVLCMVLTEYKRERGASAVCSAGMVQQKLPLCQCCRHQGCLLMALPTILPQL